MSAAAYNQANTEAMITMIVAEDDKEYREKLSMTGGMYSWAMEQSMKGEANQ